MPLATMRILAIETTTEACSVALFEGAKLIARDHRVLGRGHAEALVPMIASLPGKGRAARICVSRGPGSFTGVRIGIAAARALGVAWGAEVLGFPTLALVAAQGFHLRRQSLTVCMNGGHGEWFVQNFEEGAPQDEVRSLAPEAARAACRHELIVGNRAQPLAQMFDGAKTAIDCLPDARKMHLLAEASLTAQLTPIYGRAPDAKPASRPRRAAPTQGEP